ncbi:MAG: FkbM family methyltransferase [Myxococcota bacterium]
MNTTDRPKRASSITIPEEIRQRGLMSWPESDIAAPDTAEVVARVVDHPYCDLRVQLDPVMGSKIANLIEIGDYELTDLALFETYLRTGDTVLDIGGGVGIAAAFISRLTGRPVYAVEPDARLHPLIRRNAELNGAMVEIIEGCVAPGPTRAEPTYVDFYVHKEFWRSSINRIRDGEEYASEPIKTRAFALPELMARVEPDAVICDVEGAESNLFNTPIGDHKPTWIFIEIHTPDMGERATAGIIQQIIEQGYALRDFRAWMFVFERRV